MRGASVMVTGASGFVGRALIATLVDEGARVYALALPPIPVEARAEWAAESNMGSRDDSILDSGRAVEWIPIDLADADAVREVVARLRPAAVIHAAAVVDLARSHTIARACVEANVGGTLNLLAALAGDAAAARALGALVYVSTTDVYGDGPVPFDEAQRERPVSPYGATKLAGEHLCRVYHRAFGLPAVIARVATAYGPAQRGERLVPTAVRAFLDRAPLRLGGDGGQRRDLVYVDDIAAGLVACAACPEAIGETINLGHEEPIALAEVVDQIRRLIDPALLPAAWMGEPRAGEPRLWASRSERARALLDWRPRVTLDEGLRRTIEYYASLPAPLASPAPPASRNDTASPETPHHPASPNLAKDPAA